MKDQKPLLSSSVMLRTALIAGILLIFLGALNVGIKWYGERILQAGHTTATEDVEIVIGNDRLKLAKNTLRAPSERLSGERERVDLYLSWPDLRGYEDANRSVFDDPTQAAGLIFIQLSQKHHVGGYVRSLRADLFTPDRGRAGAAEARPRAAPSARRFRLRQGSHIDGRA